MAIFKKLLIQPSIISQQERRRIKTVRDGSQCRHVPSETAGRVTGLREDVPRQCSRERRGRRKGPDRAACVRVDYSSAIFQSWLLPKWSVRSIQCGQEGGKKKNTHADLMGFEFLKRFRLASSPPRSCLFSSCSSLHPRLL